MKLDQRVIAKGLAAGVALLATVVAGATTPVDEAAVKYPQNVVNGQLKEACRARGIVLTDYHIHIRGGITPELACAREEACGIRSSAIENHGREWEVSDNNALARFAENARRAKKDMPIGIQVNDRDWFRQIDAKTRARFDYILADTMIMGKRPDGRDNRLWEPQSIPNPEAWMERYMDHHRQVLNEPITIWANPTYLPGEIGHLYDRLWTEERMRELIALAVKNKIAIEIQAESLYPRPKFLKLAKEMGAKFSFGTNNFDYKPKNLSRWLEVIEWLDLRADDVLR